ncbi:hypothetical protein [Tardiphaga sp.]|jgi:hypothetical protein|uniref:hypothetical protein n=1 Tax=Tardiphaga sp. TaxID=1926292 RepID=UPI0037D9CA57
MSLTFPIPRGTRTVSFVTGPGQTVFGPIPFVLYDARDVALLSSPPGGGNAAYIESNLYTVTPASPSTAFPALFMVTLNAALPASSQLEIRGVRIPDRTTDVTRAGVLQSQKLEAEIDKLVLALQEVRRDLNSSALASLGNMFGLRLRNLGEPMLPTDATTKGYVDTRDGTLQLQINALAVSGLQSPAFPSRDAARVSNIGPGVTYVSTAGYSVPGDNGGALYRRVMSQPSHAGKFQSADGAWWELASSPVTPQMFGAKADCISRGVGTDDSAAFNIAYTTARLLKTYLLVPPGRYRWAQQVLFDVGAIVCTSFLGAGEGETTFMIDTSVPSPQFQITNRTGPVSAGQYACFYGKFAGFTVESYCTNGIGLLIGEGDTLPSGNTSCYFNGTWFGPIVVANRAPSVNSIGVLTSGLVTSWCYLTANCGGVPASHGGGAADFYGTAHKVQHCTMTEFHGANGNARIGTHIAGNGSVFGCTWFNVDWEVLGTCFKCDNPNAGGNGFNKISGGTMTLCDWVFDVTDGQGLLAEGHLIGDVRIAIIKNHDSDIAGVYGGHGLILRRNNQSLIGKVRNGSFWDGNVSVPPGPGSPVSVQPVMPPRGTWFKNRWGQAAIVYVYGDALGANAATLQIWKRAWHDYSSGGQRVAVGPISTIPIRLEPGQSIMIPASLAATATWFWEPAE